jgi:hypothetical protein
VVQKKKKERKKEKQGNKKFKIPNAGYLRWRGSSEKFSREYSQKVWKFWRVFLLIKWVIGAWGSFYSSSLNCAHAFNYFYTYDVFYN